MKGMKLAGMAVLVGLAAACSNGKQEQAERPIGVFDSGTGGLTVLEKILSLDAFDNRTGAQTPDGVPDFAAEDFQYLADQANMPYGVYDAQGNAELLRRLVRDDARFLIGEKQWLDAAEEQPTGEKAPCKILVIACNTATAYGLDDVRQMLDGQGQGTRVIGVINAGVKAALDALAGESEPFAVGVLATPGTISSGAYERTLRQEIEARAIQTPVTIVNQSGYGFAEAVDSDPDFVDPSLKQPRPGYRGPRLGTADADIKEDLLEAYNFEPEGLLYRSAGPLRTDLQLNSAANFARFNLVSLIERHRASGSQAPLKAIILGCTHYPFLLATLERTVAELRNFEKDGVQPYRAILPEDLTFIDPARYVAIECYRALQEDGLLKPSDADVDASRTVRGFISVPAATLDPSCRTPEGALTFEYKYGRPANITDSGTRPVPFSDDNIDENNRTRIRTLLPVCSKELGL